MDEQIKKYADSGDLRSLKYVFSGCLDADPTFVSYEEEYKYCCSIPGLLEEHVELTPFESDTAVWDEDYWTSLKMDLIKNFSDRRMTHMREVAKVYMKDKMERILKERGAYTHSAEAQPQQPVRKPATTISIPQSAKGGVRTDGSLRLDERRRELETANRAVEQEQEAQRKRIEQKKQMLTQEKEEQAKKSKGMLALAVLAGIVLIAVILIFLWVNNQHPPV